MASFKGICVYCRDYKSLFYALASKDTRHCSKCHKEGRHKTEAPREETKGEYYARLARQIKVKNGVATYSEAELGPMSPTIEAIYSKPKEPRTTRLVVQQTQVQINYKQIIQQRNQQKQSDKDLEELRQANRRQMDYRRKHYTQRQSRTSLTSLK